MARQPDPTPPADETVDLSTLAPDPLNARRHPDRNLAALEASLREVGAARSIVVDESGVVLAGNATVAAAGKAGITSVLVVDADGTELVAVRRSGLTEEQKRRLALFDNRTAELAEWDADVLTSLAENTDLSGLWDDDELADLLAGLAEEPVPMVGDPDDVPELPEEPVTQPGDLWLLGPHRLLCGDATNPEDVRRLMAGTRAVVMPTDPPYLVDYTGGNHPQSWSNRPVVKDKHWDSYQEGHGAAFFTQFLRVALAEALVPNPALYQFHATRRQALVETAWRANGLLVHQTVVWVKARPVLTRSDYMWQHEPCFYGWVEGKRPDKRPPANATTVWAVDQIGESDGVHPTQKPVELVRRMVEHHTEKGEAVYEPFAGSGTAVAACELTGRVCYALEVSPAFCDVVVARWERLTGKTAERVPAERDVAARPAFPA